MALQGNIMVYGAGGVGREGYDYGTLESTRKVLEILKSNGVTHIDTAQLYSNGKSEEYLGQLNAIQDGFIVDTKWVGGWTGKAWASSEKVVTTAKESYERLNLKSGDSVDIFYIHSPDLHTPFEDTLKGVDEAYRTGRFKRFGVSNFTAAMVQQVIDICEKNGYVKPTVYQGSYSASSRRGEDELFPLLRKHKFAFYAYSPIGGGFLTKDRQFFANPTGRFAAGPMDMYRKIYHRDNFMTFLDKWAKIAEEEGISKAELAFRWINHHSALKPEFGDGIIFGASRHEQVQTTVDYLKKGPLSEKAAREIDGLWSLVKNDSIIDNFEAAFGGGS